MRDCRHPSLRSMVGVSVGRDVCVLSGGSKSRKMGEDANKTSEEV